MVRQALMAAQADAANPSHAPRTGTFKSGLAALVVPGVYGRELSLRLSDSACQIR
jgi:hypothetical protein